MKHIISTHDAPKAIGPYSQAVKVGQFVFSAGQIAIKPSTGAVIEGGIGEQTEQVLENIKAVIQASGANLSSVVKTNVYLVNADDFAAMNEVYARYFQTEPPARTTIFVKALPKGVLVEIDAIAQL